MAIIGEWIRQLGYLVRRGARDEELRREMEAHRALMQDPRAFGNTLRLRDEARDAWGWRWLDDLTRDTRFALRTLGHSPGFTLTAILTLALGIGANVGMFALVYNALLRPLYGHPDQVVEIYSRGTKPPGGYRGISYQNYLDLRDSTTEVFANVAAFSVAFVGLDAGDGAQRTLASNVTANYFQIFDRPLALGRPFTPEEERLGADIRVAILAYSLWRQRGADPAIIGRSLRINGALFTVVGVAAQGFTGPSVPGPEIWLPLGALRTIDTSAPRGAPAFDTREAHELGVVGRLRAGTSIETASLTIATVGRRLEQAFPATNGGYTLEISVPSRLLFMPGPGSGALTAAIALLLMVMPAIVLLVACLNLANLLLARGHVRQRELAIRSSLGGGRGRLVRQLLTEGLLLALAGGAVGLMLSRWAAGALLASLRPVLPVALSLPDLAFDWRVLAATIAFSVIASLVFCAWPAWSVVSITRRATLTDATREGAGEARQPGGIRLGNALVIGQIALSLLLLASGGLFLMSAIAAATADPGFALEGGLLAQIDPSLAGYDEARSAQLYRVLLERLRAIPGVDAVTVASNFPFSSFNDSRDVARAGDAVRSTSVDAVFTVIGRNYARTLGLRMLAGRDFSDAELGPGSSEPVAIVDKALAQRLWPKGSALGQTIRFVDAERGDGALRVIGIVPAVKHSLGNPRPFPHVYVPLGQQEAGEKTLLVRAARGQDEAAMLATIGRITRGIDARVPVLRLETWSEHLHSGLDVWIYRAAARVCGAFAGMALVLAVIGAYGVNSYLVSRRTREFGIRIAIGARPPVLLWQVLREGGRVTIVGIAIGLSLALVAGRLLQTALYGVNSVEPVVLVTAPLILIGASLLASFVPALRATRVDPTVALRAE